MTAALLTTECESARRAANTTSAPTMTEAISQNHDDHTLEAPAMQYPSMLLLPAVTLTESGPRPEPRSAMRVVYDRRRELRKAITGLGGAVCTHCDGHGWGHPADDGEVWPCYWCVDGIMPLAAAPALVVDEAPVLEDTAVIVVDHKPRIVVDWLPEHDWLTPVGDERGFEHDCPVCLGWGELADLRDPANPERVDCAVCDGTGARRGTTLYTTRRRIIANSKPAGSIPF